MAIAANKIASDQTLDTLGKDTTLQAIKNAILALPNATQTAADNANAAATAANTAVSRLESLVAYPYSTSATYAVGQHVTYDGKYWRCVSAITTPESWTAAHWTEDNPGREIYALDKKTEAYGDVSGTVIATPFSKVAGFYDASGTWTSYSEGVACEKAVSAGDVYLITGRNMWTAAVIVFFDSSNNVLSTVWYASDDAVFFAKTIIVPGGAVKMLIQQYDKNTLFSLFKVSDKGAMLSAGAVQYKGETVSDILTDITAQKTQNVSLGWQEAEGFIDKWGTLYEYAGISIAYVSVNSGETYLWDGYAYYDMASILYYYDNDVFFMGTQVGDDDGHYNREITVPLGVKKLAFQKYTGQTVTLKKVTGYGVKAQVQRNVLNGKKVTVIGDSITEYNFRAKTNWSMWLAQWTGADVQNLGVSGTGFAASSPYIDRISSIQATPDIIGVAMSFNDMIDSLPVGTSSDTGTSSLAGYANDFFDALITAYPTTPIICYCQGPWQAYHPGVSKSDDWASVLKSICALKGIPFYDDLYFGCVLRPWISANRTAYYTSDNDDIGNTGVVDNTHPNSHGHKAIARYLYPRFAQNLVATGLDYDIAFP